VRVLGPRGAGWPAPLRRELERRVRSEWPSNRIYGPIHSSVGLRLRYPLVTASVGGRVLVPVLESSRLQILGQLELPEPLDGPRRVVVLVDASSSANTRIDFETAGGRVERIPVLEAQRRALDHLAGLLGSSALDVGVIAFGERTWPVVEPSDSPEVLRAALARFRQDHPRGEGRTDAVCALWTAVDWLEDAPRDSAREIVLLTDGDLPHSGRFTDCAPTDRERGSEARAACAARVNRSRCPALHRFVLADGASDLVQLANFSRRAPRTIRVSPLVFEPDRRARIYRDLARRSGGRMVRVPSAQAIEAALPALVSGRVQRVVAHNVSTGDTSPDLVGADGRSISGEVALAAGANDIELRVESERGLAGLFRFRVYSEPGHRSAYLDQLKSRTRTLEDRVRDLGARPVSERSASVQVVPESVPASAASP
jgi:Mg-chelatase subunit ChlD